MSMISFDKKKNENTKKHSANVIKEQKTLLLQFMKKSVLDVW